MSTVSDTMAAGWPELVRGVPKGLERGLQNFWYLIIQSHELPADRPVGLKCIDEDLVVFRDDLGVAHVLRDRCPHRWVKLSAGRVLDGQLQCAFHGLRFSGDGECTLVPWEQDGRPIPRELCATAYPTCEIGGYVWAYIGDVKRFPPPPIEDSVPEELLHPDRFIHFSLPTDEWNANWLLVIDGSDSYHAVTLHVESQQHDAVLGYIDAEAAAGYAGGALVKRDGVPIGNRRVRIVETEGHGLRGLSVDREGKFLDHGHRLEPVMGERFNLPGLVTNALRPVANAAPYVSRLFQVPIDYGRTRLFRYAAWRIESEADRERYRAHFEKVVRPRQIRTAREDAKMMEAVGGDLVESWSNEFLLAPDRDVVRIRRRLAAAFLAQQLEGQRSPAHDATPNRASMVFPV